MNRDIDIAQAIADATRLDVLHRLMEGPTAVAELVARLGKPQSLVSNHLAVLKGAGLVVSAREGRKSIYRLADPAVATLIESLSALSASGGDSRVTPALARARTCYDHLAGAMGVELYEWLANAGALARDGDDLKLGPKGAEVFARLGVDVTSAAKARRRFAIACLDWTERKAHLGGSLGAALCESLVTRGWVARQPRTRALIVTTSGARNLRKLMA